MPKKPKKTSKYSRSRKKSVSSFRGMDFSEILKPEIKKEKSYLELLKERFSKGKAYKITFKDIPNLLYFTFAENDETARQRACDYFRDNSHPAFITKNNKELWMARAKRIPELDEYSFEGKVPIPQLMKHLSVTFPCSNCGKDNFNYSDYEKKRCYIIEGDGDLNDFTKGFILCYDCHKKYMQ